jgi:hypothetical protein
MAAYAYGTSNVILAKHELRIPDDGLCKPKYFGAAFMILMFFNNLTI